MQVLAGSSGYSYKPWKGPFYPEGLADAAMLGHYAGRLPTVEINNTFYRMPKSAVMQKWAGDVTGGFVFAIKASQRITHKARLKDTEETIGYLWRSISHLGPHLGPVLFQLPPYLRKDAPRLADFLASLPEGLRAAMEFRHESWDDEEVHSVLRDAGAALVAADDEKRPCGELVPTADWGYLRLRRPGYDAKALDGWAERVTAQPWERAFVYFKHEEEGAAPRMAHDFMDRCGGG